LLAFLVAAALAVAIICLLSMQPVEASQLDVPVNREVNAPVFQAVNIFTDTFDTLQINDTAATASTLPIAVCAAAQPQNNLTIYRAILPPAADIDYYRIAPAGQRIITVTVTIQGPTSDLSVNVQLLDASGSNVLAAGLASLNQPATLTSYNLNLGTQFFIRVSATNPNLPGTEGKPYSLLVCQSDVVVTPTGPPPTPPPTPQGANPDAYEPNNSPAEVRTRNVSFINVGQQLTSLNFYTTALGSTGGPPIFAEGDVDWYFFFGRAGSTYRVTTEVQPGVDTEMFIYRPDQLPPDNNFTTVGLIAANDDYRPLDRGSQVIFTGLFDGIYWIKLWNKDQSPRVAGQTYNLSVVEVAPSTPLPTIPPTPYPSGADRFEYNGDFDSATLIAPGVKYDNLNFVPFQPPTPDTVDNDFFRLPVKQGVYYTCETLDLTGGTDTNIIVYNQDRIGIGGNDDISPENKALGRFESRFTWLSGYTGYAYILIGEVNPPRASEGQIRGYSLICNIGIPATPTPTPNPNPPTATPPLPPPTPPPPENTPTPFPTPRPAQNLIVRPVDPGALQPTPAPSPTPRTLLIDVQVFNDFNRNGLLDPGEGIANASVRLSDEQSGTPLGQGFTDGDGRVRFSVVNDGPVRVAVPLLSFSTVVNETPATIRIGIEPAITPPERIP
jgi:hypothetical protein